MSRIFRAIGLTILTVCILLAALLAYLSYSTFFRYQVGVDKIYEAIPQNEKHLSSAARRVFTTLEPESHLSYLVSTWLLSELTPQHVRMAEWHMRNAFWMLLLPHRIGPEARIVLYAHYLPLEGGRGVAYGAQKYFGKLPSQLSETDALILFTIARSPSANSPTLCPDRFRERLWYYTNQYLGRA